MQSITISIDTKTIIFIEYYSQDLKMDVVVRPFLQPRTAALKLMR